MGLDQLGVPTVATLVPKEGGHTLSLITLLAIPPWFEKPALLVGSPKMITLGHIPCNTWSTRHSVTLLTTSMGVQGTIKAAAELRKHGMWTCLKKRTGKRVGLSTFTETGVLPEC